VAELTQSLYQHLRREASVERAFRSLTFACAVLVLALLLGVTIALIHGSMPALMALRTSFLTQEVWNPVTDKFGALAPFYGTVITSLLAMLIAVPISFGIAVFLTETCPNWLRRPIGTAIELLAAIPSIVSASGACSCSHPCCSATCSLG
jgi:phosphate transport system permease protein